MSGPRFKESFARPVVVVDAVKQTGPSGHVGLLYASCFPSAVDCSRSAVAIFRIASD